MAHLVVSTNERSSSSGTQTSPYGFHRSDRVHRLDNGLRGEGVHYRRHLVYIRSACCGLYHLIPHWDEFQFDVFDQIESIHRRILGPQFRLRKLITNGCAGSIVPIEPVCVQLHRVREHVHAADVDTRNDEGGMQSYHFLL